MTFYRVVGAREFELISTAGWLAFPPLPKAVQAFHAAGDLDTAVELAEIWKIDWENRDWIKDADYWTQLHDGLPAEWEAWGNPEWPRHVMAFELPQAWRERRPSRGLRVAADELGALNDELVGPITLVQTLSEPDGAVA